MTALSVSSSLPLKTMSDGMALNWYENAYFEVNADLSYCAGCYYHYSTGECGGFSSLHLCKTFVNNIVKKKIWQHKENI